MIVFLVLNFIVSFLSDIVLNDLSYFITPLRSYFYKQSIIKSAFVAGLTVLIALVINILFSYFLFGFSTPSNNNQLIFFTSLAFIIGFVFDALIYKLKIFGNRLYNYKKVGVGFWGAMAFVFSIVISYFLDFLDFLDFLLDLDFFPPR
jgi:hypothetical protein